jgi:hypothetical protein
MILIHDYYPLTKLSSDTYVRSKRTIISPTRNVTFAAVSTVTYWLRSMRQRSNATMAVRMFLYCSLVYVKANKEQSFVSMTVALRFTWTKRVRSLPPVDK